MAIYFWNLQALKMELGKGNLPQPQAFMYLLVSSMSTSLVLGSTPEWAIITGWQGILLWALGLAITGYGIFYCYRANGGADGMDFLSRFISLGWVIGIRLGVFCIPLIVFLFLSTMYLTGGSRSEPKPIWVCIISLFVGMIYWRIGASMAEINLNSGNPSAASSEQ